MASTVRILNRWIARLDAGGWSIIEGARVEPGGRGSTPGLSLDDQRLREARILYPSLEVWRRGAPGLH